MNNVIRLQKAEKQQMVLSLSLLSLIVTAVLAHDYVTKSVRPSYLTDDRLLARANRSIASTTAQEEARDIRWEHDLARSLSSLTARFPASLGQQASPLDQLRYGDLAGKYHLTQIWVGDVARISEVEYIDSSAASDHPVLLRNRAQFLAQYRDIWSVPFVSYVLEESRGEKETYQLFDGSGHKIGQAEFKLSEDGRFLSLKMQETR